MLGFKTKGRARIRARELAGYLVYSHDRCAGLHGHTYRVEALVAGTPKNGVLSDFREVRKALRAATDDYDHADLSVQFDYPSCETLCVERNCEQISKCCQLHVVHTAVH